MVSKSITNNNITSHQSLIVSACISYVVLLAYGTLYPLTGWHWQLNLSTVSLALHWPKHPSSSDLVTNLVVYMPVGMLLYWSFPRTFTKRLNITLVTVIGTCTSLLLEYLQIFLPSRVPSLVDVCLNGAGSLLGAFLAGFFQGNSKSIEKISNLWQETFKSGPLTFVGASAVVLWALYQSMPLVPSMDMGTLKSGIKPIWYVIQDPTRINLWQIIVYALNIAALGWLYKTLLRNYYGRLTGFFIFCFGVLLYKIPVVSRQLSIEALMGLTVGILFGGILGQIISSKRVILTLSACFIVVAFVVDGTHEQLEMAGIANKMNWIPFREQMINLAGLADIMASIWPFVALAYIALFMKPENPFLIALIGGALVFTMTFSIEWLQQYIPGRHPDITDVVLPLLAFLTACWYYHLALSKNAGDLGSLRNEKTIIH